MHSPGQTGRHVILSSWPAVPALGRAELTQLLATSLAARAQNGQLGTHPAQLALLKCTFITGSTFSTMKWMYLAVGETT